MPADQALGACLTYAAQVGDLGIRRVKLNRNERALHRRPPVKPEGMTIPPARQAGGVAWRRYCPDNAAALTARRALHEAGGGAERRRSIKLLAAGWLPHSVLPSRGFPRSRGRASEMMFRPRNQRPEFPAVAPPPGPSTGGGFCLAMRFRLSGLSPQACADVTALHSTSVDRPRVAVRSPSRPVSQSKISYAAATIMCTDVWRGPLPVGPIEGIRSIYPTWAAVRRHPSSIGAARVWGGKRHVTHGAPDVPASM
jgi:hypothetical protein